MTKPARNVNKMSAVKNLVKFPALKSPLEPGRQTITVESILESEYCLHLEFDPTVVVYYPQPKTYQVPTDEGMRRYTPDFRVQFEDQSVSIVEVKTVEDGYSDDNQYLFEQFQANCLDENTSFLLVDDLEIRQQPLLQNYEELYEYLDLTYLDEAVLNRCAGKVSGKNTLSSLMESFVDDAPIEEIYTWIATGFLKFNIQEVELNLASEMEFHV